MSTHSILKKTVFASLFAIAGAAPAAFAGSPAPSFNDFPEHYADAPVVQDRGAKARVDAPMGAGEVLRPVPSFNDHPEHYSAGTPTGAKAGTGAKTTIDAGSTAPSFASLQLGVPAY